jgi:HEAT repeat protein
MATKEDKEKRIHEIQRRQVQIKIQMDHLRQAAFLKSRATGSDRFHQQHAKKDLDRLTEENEALTKELAELTKAPAKKVVKKSPKKTD